VYIIPPIGGKIKGPAAILEICGTENGGFMPKIGENRVGENKTAGMRLIKAHSAVVSVLGEDPGRECPVTKGRGVGLFAGGQLIDETFHLIVCKFAYSL